MALALDAPRFGEFPLPIASFEVPSSARAPSLDGPSPFERLARGLSAAIDGGDQLVITASRGSFGQMDAATLIALQAGIYRYSEAVDLCAKLVDRTANATRTVLEAGR